MIDSKLGSPGGRNLRLATLTILALAALPVLAADVYRSVDENGNVVYSDRPSGQDTRRVELVVSAALSAPRPSAAASEGVLSGDAAGMQSEDLTAEVRVEPTPEEIAAERTRNCAVAQERAERYRVSQRLYRTAANGEREYLSDAELDDARAKADADVANWCG